MKEIKLSLNKIALVDDDDFEQLNIYKWHSFKHRNTYYARRNENVMGINKQIYMHTQITGIKGIDHVDRNGLNNQRDNLRKCTSLQNNYNSLRIKNKTSIFKGVSWNKYHNKWKAQISVNGKRKHIGYFDNDLDAAVAYDKNATEYYKEFAYLNSPFLLD